MRPSEHYHDKLQLNICFMKKFFQDIGCLRSDKFYRISNIRYLGQNFSIEKSFGRNLYPIQVNFISVEYTPGSRNRM